MTLVGDLYESVSRLVRGEVSLARAEIEAQLRRVIFGVVFLLLGALLCVVALGILGDLSISYLVSRGLSIFSAGMIVVLVILLFAAVLAFIGAGYLRAGAKIPGRTAENIKADTLTVKEAMQK